jgi:hypothetical protein
MSGFYVYLISSLPMLQFGIRPAFSWDDFLERCQRLIPEKDAVLLKNLPGPGQYAGYSGEQETVRRWIEFDTALRNELVKLRVGRKRTEAAKYLRAQDYCNLSVAQAAMSADRNPTPQEAELNLDRARWDFLEDLSFGHYFDLDSLIAYAYKLKILWRWEEVRRADKGALLEGVLA